MTASRPSQTSPATRTETADRKHQLNDHHGLLALVRVLLVVVLHHLVADGPVPELQGAGVLAVGQGVEQLATAAFAEFRGACTRGCTPARELVSPGRPHAGRFLGTLLVDADLLPPLRQVGQLLPRPCRQPRRCPGRRPPPVALCWPKPLPGTKRRSPAWRRRPRSQPPEQLGRQRPEPSARRRQPDWRIASPASPRRPRRPRTPPPAGRTRPPARRNRPPREAALRARAGGLGGLRRLLEGGARICAPPPRSAPESWRHAPPPRRRVAPALKRVTGGSAGWRNVAQRGRSAPPPSPRGRQR